MPSSDLIHNRYRILRELGKGGMSRIYLARDEELHDRPVVVKILKEIRAQEWIIKKFKQEIEALTRINHPGVVGVLDAGELENGQLFVVIEFVEGIDLRTLLNQQHGKLAFGLVSRILYQVGHALHAAHQKGVLHCDLKPENIMIQTLDSGHETVKLIDFGIAKIRDSKVHSLAVTQVAGTVRYMAPEQLEGTPSPATDVFALGVIAYEMLTGEVPFPARNILELFTMQRGGVRKLPKDLRTNLSEAAQGTILKALSLNPADRFAHVQEFTGELAKSLRASEVANPAFTTESWPMVNRSKMILLIVSVLLILGSIVGIVYETVRKDDLSGPANISPPVPVSAVSTLQLHYWILVENRDGSISKKPFLLSKEINFEAGDRIQIGLRAKQEGYVYILNEGPVQLEQKTQFVVMFPSTLEKRASAHVNRDQEIVVPGIGWFIFDQERGPEKIWIVYSIKPIPVLEAVSVLANPDDKGMIRDTNQIDAVQSILKQTATADVEKSDIDWLKVLTTKGEQFVHALVLEHH